MANYKVSPNAKDDLRRIWFYGLENWDLEAADYYHNAFYKHFEKLAAEPLLYAETDVRKGYRRSMCGRDNVYYCINGKTVEIMAILGQ